MEADYMYQQPTVSQMLEQGISAQNNCSAAGGFVPPPPPSSPQEESSADADHDNDNDETCHSPPFPSSSADTGAISPPAQQQKKEDPLSAKSGAVKPRADLTASTKASSVAEGVITTTPTVSQVLSGGVTPIDASIAAAKATTSSTGSTRETPPASTTASTADRPTAGKVSAPVLNQALPATHIASAGAAAAAALVAVSTARPTSAMAITKTEKSTAAPGRARKTTSGRWTREEHEQFLEGLKVYGREWKKVAQRIPTRTSAQIRSHAQKYFAKLAREEQARMATVSAIAREHHGGMEFEIGAGMTGGGDGEGDGDGTTMFLPPDQHSLLLPGAAISPVQLTSSAMNRVGRILSDPEAVQVEVEDTLAALKRRYHELQRRLHGNGATDRGNDGHGDVDGHGDNIALQRPPSTAMRKDDINSSCSGTASGKKRKIGEDMMTSTTTTTTQEPQHRILESRELWTEELIALSVLGGSLQQGDSPKCEEPAVESISEGENHSTTDTYNNVAARAAAGATLADGPITKKAKNDVDDSSDTED
eukprot:CAMPEP_0181057682 /NCGR_PEP_ID=MMETSP1070-20121207/20381_1 /TAXON_ID=265543 /ORGANISM="Minutocellus polymorphus, Strain NH13" /LENGTH=536 /DNA_ID=CAMNT_0023137113 /DNA_START=24 /DNA_END=1634 /DNA_ORIENTATION=-